MQLVNSVSNTINVKTFIPHREPQLWWLVITNTPGRAGLKRRAVRLPNFIWMVLKFVWRGHCAASGWGFVYVGRGERRRGDSSSVCVLQSQQKRDKTPETRESFSKTNGVGYSMCEVKRNGERERGKLSNRERKRRCVWNTANWFLWGVSLVNTMGLWTVRGNSKSTHKLVSTYYIRNCGVIGLVVSQLYIKIRCVSVCCFPSYGI